MDFYQTAATGYRLHLLCRAPVQVSKCIHRVVTGGALGWCLNSEVITKELGAILLVIIMDYEIFLLIFKNLFMKLILFTTYYLRSLLFIVVVFCYCY